MKKTDKELTDLKPNCRMATLKMLAEIYSVEINGKKEPLYAHNTLKSLAHKGAFPTYHPTKRRILVDVQEFEKWLTQNRRQPIDIY